LFASSKTPAEAKEKVLATFLKNASSVKNAQIKRREDFSRESDSRRGKAK
jgi:hypothetical protein